MCGGAVLLYYICFIWITVSGSYCNRLHIKGQFSTTDTTVFLKHFIVPLLLLSLDYLLNLFLMDL